MLQLWHPASMPLSLNAGDTRPPATPRHSLSSRGRLDFFAINQAALARWPQVVERLLPRGQAVSNEWYVGSLRGEPGRSLLASVITENPAEIRPLSHSRTVRLNSPAFICITGNGLSLSEDLARRFVVELDVGTDDPEARDFRGDLLAETTAAPADLLGDALTIWRWGATGKQPAPWPPDEQLCRMGPWCRDPLLALGCCDPADQIATTKANDPRRLAALEILGTWWREHGEQAVTIKDLSEGVRLAIRAVTKPPRSK
jgi:hypothetical protein